ncbi:MAG: patatin-like phospholipase family protein [Alphaproteobacteria bacterium]|nr:patatin-like phospholipase family protein [Alphaproteobacteria bacterium]
MRPKIGFALGSGGARGWTQIGILEALASYGIVPDVVCGTSIGALVGAAFVTGKLAALKTRIESFSRRDVAAMFDVCLTTGGLIEGRRIESFLEGMDISGAIESLDIGYGAVATELRSGREIWLRSGPIGRAVRASISIPGILSPAKYDNEWLVDGGVVNPVPVSLARAMGADIVIAVRVNTSAPEPEIVRGDEETRAKAPPPMSDLRIPQWLSEAVNPVLERLLRASPEHPSYFEVLSNSLDIMEDRITRMRLAGDPPEVLLRPVLGDMTWLDFHRAKELIATGWACAEAAKPVIADICGIKQRA